MQCTECLLDQPLDQFYRDTRTTKIVYKKRCKSCGHKRYLIRYSKENQVKHICVVCKREFSVNVKYCPNQVFCSTKCAGEGKATLDYSKSYFNNIKSWIDGLLLSDIHIRPEGSFSWNVKHLEFAQFIADKLKCYDPYLKQQKNGMWSGRTRVHPDIKKVREEWYPQGKKIVPVNVAINKESLLAMYIGDGHLHKRTGRITIATLAFSEEENKKLANSITELGIPTRIIPASKNKQEQYYLYFNRPSAEILLNFLGMSPIKCYDYKFDMPDREVNREYQRRKRRERIEKREELGSKNN